ncbi:caspase-8-like [Halichoeres trimaculatus]|uniref:caspase-8-like n=1 Tax=Halichoeres trimaculatus TaxID=147232 RepID=UPI003D9EBBA6
MSAQDKAEGVLRRNKIAIQDALCADYRLILNKVYEKQLITKSEYNNLKSISKEDVGGHVVELVDKIMFKGEKRCQAFLNLLQTDDDIKQTYPELEDLQLNVSSLLPFPVQASSSSSCDYNDLSPERKRPKQDDPYQLNSLPVGLCVIINNEKFLYRADRPGTNKDAKSLAEVFSWLGFRVLMCEDQTGEQMVQTLTCFASVSDSSQLPQLRGVKEWLGGCFTDFQGAAKHGDAFICCILSHGNNGFVTGIDDKPLSIKEIRRTFKATDQSALTGKPKVFLIQACQGEEIHRPVLVKDVQADDDCQSLYIPEEADFLVAMATVEDHPAYRHPISGTWYIQSVCKQLWEYCPRGENLLEILHRVNNEVSQKEGVHRNRDVKQMPEVRSTLRKTLVLSPRHT